MNQTAQQMVEVYGGCGFLAWFRDLWIRGINTTEELRRRIAYRTASDETIAPRLLSELESDGWVMRLDDQRWEINKRCPGVRDYARCMGFRAPRIRTKKCRKP